MKRNKSIDIVRGLVMVIMALDHVRDLLHVTSLTQSPTDLRTTTPLLFFTRWITYLCAPTFVFLAGSSAFLSLNAKGDPAGARSFLLKRGIWLILLEFTVVNFGMWFDLKFSVLIFEVIAAIGTGFILLALVVKLPPPALGLAGALILVLQGLYVPAGADAGIVHKLISALFVPGIFPYGSENMLFMAYPPLPWTGIMLIGFASGSYFTRDAPRQKKLFGMAGLIALACFMILRGFNLYGEPLKWSVQKDTIYTALSFLNVSKYPPSLQFTLLFLGLMLLLLAFTQGKLGKWTEILSAYGKAPLFYFLIHFYLIHIFLLVLLRVQGYESKDMVFGMNFGRPKAESGLPLWAVYIVWAVVVIVLYPVCKWFGKYKAAHPEKVWLRFL